MSYSLWGRKELEMTEHPSTLYPKHSSPCFWGQMKTPLQPDFDIVVSRKLQSPSSNLGVLFLNLIFKFFGCTMQHV